LASSQCGDQRDDDVGDHRHLQQHDEGVAHGLERLRHLAEEDAGGDAKDEAEQDLLGQAGA